MREALISSQVYILKAALAGVIAIILGKILVPGDLLSASFVAILCIKPTFFTGLVLGKQQLFASIIGGLFSGLLIYTFGQGILVTALSLIVVIAFCVYKKWSDYLPIAVFTVLYMVLLPQENTLETIIVRMSSVFLGVAVAATINFLVSFIRYKSFLYYRIKFALNLVYGKTLKTMEANISADYKMLEKLYTDFESIYSQLSSFASEMMDIGKELKFRRKVGAITEEEINSMYRTIENLKMVVRYVQDIAYISRMLVPVHDNIPVSWKKDIDKLWMQNRKIFEALVNKIVNQEFTEVGDFESVDFSLINEINECIKNTPSNEKKFLYSKIMAIVADFQQLHISLISLNFFANKYIDIYKKSEEEVRPA